MEGLPIVRYIGPRSHKMDTDVFYIEISSSPPHPAGGNNYRVGMWDKDRLPR